MLKTHFLGWMMIVIISLVGCAQQDAGKDAPDPAKEAESADGESSEKSTDNGEEKSEEPAEEPAPEDVGEASEPADIVDTAVAAGSFKTLAAALEAAGLVETLKSAGPFTVFAPTDEAFAALPEGTLDKLLLPESKEQLTAILTYHVVPGKVEAAAAAKLTSAKTVNGKDLTITATADGVKVGDANVVKTDIICSNGIIHVINAVVLPPAEGSEKPPHAREALVIEGVGSFKTLFAAIEAAGLTETLSKDAPFTVFAPTDEAFAALPEGTVEDLLKPENKDKLVSILTYHVVAGKVPSEKVVEMKSAETLNGAEVTITVADGKIQVEDANVLQTDVPCEVGLIHAIDKVLLP